jgi:hypothetical protein
VDATTPVPDTATNVKLLGKQKAKELGLSEDLFANDVWANPYWNRHHQHSDLKTRNPHNYL